MESISSLIASSRLSSSRLNSARRVLDVATWESPAYQPVASEGVDPKGHPDNGSRKAQRRRFEVLWRTEAHPQETKAFAEQAADFTGSWPYQSAMGLVIVANSVVIGLETDVPHYPHWNIIEHSFLAVFTLELSWRIFIFSPRVFFDASSSDIMWNTFDCIIVLLGVFDMLLCILLGSSESGGSAAQVFRVVRLLRILRIFRIVRFLKPLYMLAFGLLLAAEAIMWVSILMMFVLYVCSIILVRSVGNMPEETPHREFLEGCFGNVFQSMFTLFELMVNPYLEPYHGVLGEQPTFATFILGFVIFGSFGMIALLTGVIHENMFEKNQLRAQEERQDQEARRVLLIRRCGELFDEIDADANGVPRSRFCELEALLPRVAEMFKSNGVSLVEDDMDGIIELMDANGSGTIDKEEFCHFFLRVAEGVRPLLLMEFRQELMAFTGERLAGVVSDLQHVLKTNLAAAEASTNLLREELREVSGQLQDVLLGQIPSTQLHSELSSMKACVMDAVATGSGEARDLAAAQRDTTKALVAELRSCVDMLIRQRSTAPSSQAVRSHSPGEATVPPSAGATALHLAASSGEAQPGILARSIPRVEAVPVEPDRTRSTPLAPSRRSLPSPSSTPGPSPDRGPGTGGAPEDFPVQWQKVPASQAGERSTHSGERSLPSPSSTHEAPMSGTPGNSRGRSSSSSC